MFLVVCPKSKWSQSCQGLNMEAVSKALEMDFTEWKLAKEEMGEEGMTCWLLYLSAGKPIQSRGGDKMLTLLLEGWKTHFNHEEEIRCCLSYLIVGKGVRGHVHGGAVWSARGPLSHGRDNKVQTRAKNRNILKQAKYLWVIFLTAACQAQEAHIKNKRLNFFI